MLTAEMSFSSQSMHGGLCFSLALNLLVLSWALICFTPSSLTSLLPCSIPLKRVNRHFVDAFLRWLVAQVLQYYLALGVSHMRTLILGTVAGREIRI